MAWASGVLWVACILEHFPRTQYCFICVGACTFALYKWLYIDAHIVYAKSKRTYKTRVPSCECTFLCAYVYHSGDYIVYAPQYTFLRTNMYIYIIYTYVQPGHVHMYNKPSHKDPANTKVGSLLVLSPAVWDRRNTISPFSLRVHTPSDIQMRATACPAYAHHRSRLISVKVACLLRSPRQGLACWFNRVASVVDFIPSHNDYVILNVCVYVERERIPTYIHTTSWHRHFVRAWRIDWTRHTMIKNGEKERVYAEYHIVSFTFESWLDLYCFACFTPSFF